MASKDFSRAAEVMIAIAEVVSGRRNKSCRLVPRCQLTFAAAVERVRKKPGGSSRRHIRSLSSSFGYPTARRQDCHLASSRTRWFFSYSVLQLLIATFMVQFSPESRPLSLLFFLKILSGIASAPSPKNFRAARSRPRDTTMTWNLLLWDSGANIPKAVV